MSKAFTNNKLQSLLLGLCCCISSGAYYSIQLYLTLKWLLSLNSQYYVLCSCHLCTCLYISKGVLLKINFNEICINILEILIAYYCLGLLLVHSLAGLEVTIALMINILTCGTRHDPTSFNELESIFLEVRWPSDIDHTIHQLLFG